MAVSRTPAPADHGPTAHALNRAAARPPYPPPVPLPDQALWARVIRNARCADSSLDPDQWFPASAEAGRARHEAAAAITVCVTCFVRTQCLELSLRFWDIGQHGVWGGMVPADRAALRRRKDRAQSARSRGLEGPGRGNTTRGDLLNEPAEA
jgi:Transcription factor WhiB